MPYLLAFAVVIGLAIAAFHKLEDITGLDGERLGIALILFVALFTVGCVWIGVADARKKREREEQARLDRWNSLVARFGTQAAENIVAQRIWIGMTSEQLTECLGAPAGLDTKLTTKFTRETWKYGQTGVNRFRLRVTLDDGHVKGWEGKG